VARRLGRYEVFEEIARGGMGVVLRAHDPELNRDLAVKVLRSGLRGHAQVVQRFVEEAQITAQLPHPGVVPVHDIGRDEQGLPFLVMKLVRGQTLEDLLAQRGLPQQDLPRWVGVFEQVCQAVAFAHSRRVIHRDLKPSNVMVGRFGEVQVMDWGLAKVLPAAGPRATAVTSGPLVSEVQTLRREEAAHTQGVLGTPSYMAPEQAGGEWERVDERVDVFGLGGLLCVILTGVPPYEGSSREEVKRKALRGDVAGAYARLDGCGADEELLGLAKACLSPELEGRPADAAEVARRVAAYQAGVQERLRRAERERAAAEARTQEAKATARAQQARAQAERRARRQTLMLAVLGLMLVVGAGGAWWWYQHEQDRQLREQAARLAQTQSGVTAALAEAQALLDQRQQQDHDPDQWRATVRVAQSAVERARGLLATGVGTAELSAQVEALASEADETQRECDLVHELEGIRLEQATVRERHFDFTRAVPLYRAALLRYGIAVEDAAGAAERVRASRAREALVAALEDWWRCTPDRAERAQVQAVLAQMQLGRDSWRRRWRRELQPGGGAALAALARSKEVDGLPPAALVILARDLAALQEGSAAEQMLRAAHDRHPNDFWVNHDLGMQLLSGRPPCPAEAVGYLRAAAALRSQSPGVQVNLGLALSDKGDVDGAIHCYRKAIELDSTYATAHNNLGVALKDKGNVDGAIRCYHQAIALDPRYAQPHANLGNALKAKGDVDGAIRCYHKAIDLDPKFAGAHNNLGLALKDKGDVEGAIRCYHKALDLDPKFAVAHYNLGNALKDKGDVDGAIRCYRQATDLDPKYASAHHNLGIALDSQGDVDGAIRCFRQAIDLDPKEARSHFDLGLMLQKKGDVDGAIRCYHKAIDLNPKFAAAHSGLGNALKAKGDVDGATRCYQKAIDVDPKDVGAHNNLGLALHDKGDVDGAIRCYHKALDLDPKYAVAHYNLGNALKDKGDVDGAIRCYHKAIDLDPKYASAHHNLGTALIAKGEVDGAIRCFQKAIDLNPKYARAYTNLGTALKEKGDPAGAVRCYQKVIDLDPKHADAHYALGLALVDQGRFVDALPALRRGHELGTKRPGWRYPSADWVRRCERLVELDRKLPAVLKGQAQPASPAERLELAALCQLPAKRQYGAATRLYAEAFVAQPRLADDLVRQPRYDAACCAALAGCGLGNDAATLDAKERARCRQQALAWLRADLEAWRKRLADAKAPVRQPMRQTLRHWQKDSDLAGVREDKSLSALARPERAAWRKLWADVADLIATAERNR
jgi:tetratricopeptide (TPR) repeat protein